MLAVAYQDAFARNDPPMPIIINDLDSGVAAFWNVISGNAETTFKELRRRLTSTVPTRDLFWEIRNSKPATDDLLELAWQFFYCNRTCIMPSNGQRPMTKVGERWLKSLPREMDEARQLLKGRTTVYNTDFAEVIALAQPNWVIYLDPPYYVAGDKLYTEFTMADDKHVGLRDMLKATPADWVLSYDYHSRIFELYTEDWTRTHELDVQYSMSKREDTEALIVPLRIGPM